MRIISGYLKGRRLNPPANLPVRPTTDMAREGLFNILNNIIDFEEVDVLDLFTGIGSIAFEFVSRGCKNVTCIDTNFKCIDFIKKTAAIFELSNLYPIRTDVFMFISRRQNKQFDIIFADPPYDLQNINVIPDHIFKNNLLTENGILILEHSAHLSFTEHPCFFQHRKYGKVNFTFFKQKEN